MMDKTFDPAAVEARVSAAWEQADAFRAGRPERAGAEPYCIMIPPPNVTGSLHMGHALNNTIQDILARFERMRGRDVLWQPAWTMPASPRRWCGRAQARRNAAAGPPDPRPRGIPAPGLGLEGESGGTIIGQLKRLGASCDWSRERFTMDEGLSRAVLKTFVDLHAKGLIYRDKRLVNWDPKFQTAISDLEVQQIETKGHLWHFDYRSWTRPASRPATSSRSRPPVPRPCSATPRSRSTRRTSATPRSSASGFACRSSAA